MAMTKKARQQISVLIVVAVMLILLTLIGAILFPFLQKNPTSDKPSKNPNVEQVKNTIDFYTVTVKMLDSQYNAIKDTKFIISYKDTIITTDANGYIILKNLPEGLYKIHSVDENGNKKESVFCDFQLSSDGGVSVGYVFFAKDAVVYIMCNGTSLVGIQESSLPKKETAEKEEEPVYEEEDPTYTNFSWMKNIEKEYGAYGVNLYRDPELFYEILNNPEYSYFNTFLLPGNNLELTLKTAEELTLRGKKMWIDVNELITFKSFGGDPVSGNLHAEWQDIVTEWATEVRAVAGDLFQGFYFDEPSYYYNSRDFTRITKYMRESFKVRTFACHCSAAYMTPYNRKKDIIGYTPAPNDPMVINAENHKYVTDVAWWRYGSIRDFGDIDVSFNEWSKAMSLLDKNTRKWYVPAIGAYYWDTIETDTLDIQYTMFKNNAALEGFGGIMHYTMTWSSLSGRPTPVSEDDERLTEKDYYIDENGKKIIALEHNYSSANRKDAYMEGNGAYYVMEKQENGSYRWPKVRQYMDILGIGLMKGEPYETILAKLEEVYKPDFSKYE